MIKLNRHETALLGANFLGSLAIFSCVSFLGVVLSQRYGFSSFLIGCLLGGGALLGAIGGIYLGHLSDSIGRKIPLFLSVGTLACLVGGLFVTDSVLIFAACAAGVYLAKGLHDSVLRVAIADFAGTESKELVFSLRFLGLNLGAGLGPWLVTYLGASLNGQAYLYSSIFFVFYMLLVIKFFPAGRPGLSEEFPVPNLAASIHLILRDAKFLAIVLAGTCFMASIGQYVIVLPQYLQETDPVGGIELFSQLCLANSISICLSQIPVTILTKKSDDFTVCIYGFVVACSAFLLMYLLPPSRIYILALTIMGLAETLLAAKMDVIVERLAPFGKKGLYFGAFSGIQLGMIMGAAGGGLLLDLGGKRFLLSSVTLLAIGAGLVLRYANGRQKRLQKPAFENALAELQESVADRARGLKGQFRRPHHAQASPTSLAAGS